MFVCHMHGWIQLFQISCCPVPLNINGWVVIFKVCFESSHLAPMIANIMAAVVEGAVLIIDEQNSIAIVSSNKKVPAQQIVVCENDLTITARSQNRFHHNRS